MKVKRYQLTKNVAVIIIKRQAILSCNHNGRPMSRKVAAETIKTLRKLKGGD